MTGTGLLFPGQGSQSAGMGKVLYHELDLARELLDSACKILDIDLRHLIFEGSPEELRKTENAQVSIFLVSMMCFEKWKTKKKEFSIVAGHSLGEYSALCAAEVLSFEDCLRLVSVRGRLMANCCREDQGMKAILGLPLEQVLEVIEQNQIKVEVANINSSKQIVLSGLKAELLKIEDILYNTNGCAVKWLNVAGAFHSSFMTPARIQLQKEICKVPFRKPVCPVISNVTGQETVDLETSYEKSSIN